MFESKYVLWLRFWDEFYSYALGLNTTYMH